MPNAISEATSRRNRIARHVVAVARCEVALDPHPTSLRCAVLHDVMAPLVEMVPGRRDCCLRSHSKWRNGLLITHLDAPRHNLTQPVYAVMQVVQRLSTDVPDTGVECTRGGGGRASMASRVGVLLDLVLPWIRS